MKADESAVCAGSCGSSFPTGLCAFLLFWGLEIRKMNFKNSDFGWGPDLVMPSTGGSEFSPRDPKKAHEIRSK
jgi:hypothetical protein